MDRLKIVSAGLLLMFMSAGFAGAEDGTTKTGTKPGTIKVVDPVSGDWLFTLGGAMCQNNTVSLPGSCITAGAGGVFFDLSHLNTTSRTSHVFEGNVTVSVLQSFTGGTFNVTVCNDRDDDALCANNDVVDEDIGSDHGTSPRHDDQFAQAEHSKNRQSPTVLPFCFADDAFTHDIDDIVIFVGTVATQPSIGTASVHLSTITMVGDDTSGCTSVNYQNTHGTRDWL